MNDYIEYELQDYDTEHKEKLHKKANETKEIITDLTDMIEIIFNATDRKTILEKGYSLYFRTNDIRQAYFHIIDLKEELGLISKEESSRMRKEGYNIDEKDMYWKIKDFDMGKISNAIDESTFRPDKGTHGYCLCKGYNYLSRVEIGKMVKRDLKEEFPECDFSVTTEEGYWNDIVNVKFFKAPPETYGETDYSGRQGLKESFIREIEKFCEEYEPRVNIRVYRYL